MARGDGLALGEVRLEVPASPEFFRIARIMGAGVASRLGFTLDELEDLTVAIDELCFALVGRGAPGTLALVYEMHPDSLAVAGAGRFGQAVVDDPVLSPFSAQILSAVTDEYVLGRDGEGPRFRMVKHRQASDA